MNGASKLGLTAMSLDITLYSSVCVCVCVCVCELIFERKRERERRGGGGGGGRAVSESGMKWKKSTVPISMAGMNNLGK